MPERIVISFRPAPEGRIYFVIHEQPAHWFRLGMASPSGAPINEPVCRIGDLNYCLVRAACPQMTLITCYVANDPRQLHAHGYWVGPFMHRDYTLTPQAMRNGLAALVNIARSQGYEFRIVP